VAVFKLIFVGIVIILFLTASSWILYKRELQNNPSLKENSLDFSTVYGFYTANKPSIGELPFYGDSKAGVTLIAYLDLNSTSSSLFMSEFFPQVKRDFIDTGKLRYYQKYYVTREDYLANTDRFINTKMLYCIMKLNKSAYFNINLGFFNGTEYAGYGISESQLKKCMEGPEPQELMNNIMEVQKLGILGKKQRLYLGIDNTNNLIIDGIPTYSQFRKSLIPFIFRVGESV